MTRVPLTRRQPTLFLRFFLSVSFLRAADANRATAECVTNNNLRTVLGKNKHEDKAKNQKT